MDEVDEVTEFDAQVAEAEASAIEPAKVQTKTITWRDRTWQIRHTPGARFVYEYEHERPMSAAEAVLGDRQMRDLLALDPDLKGPDGMDDFFRACNRAWGLSQGN